MPLTQKIDEPQLGSGYGIVSRPGQIIFRKSNSPEEIIGEWENKKKGIWWNKYWKCQKSVLKDKIILV